MKRGMLVIVSLAALGLAAGVLAQMCVLPPSGMVGWWSGDGDGNDLADNNPGTLQNGTTYATGMVGQAFSFDGIDDFVQIPNAGNLQITGPITIDAWLYLRTGTFYPSIVSKGNVGNYLESYDLFTGNGDSTVNFLLNSNGTPGGRTIVWGPAIPLNTWTHVAGTYDGTIMRLYVNGALVASELHSGGINVTTDPVLIAKADRTSSPSPYPDSFLNGDVDEVEIFGRALSASEILALYNAGSLGKCRQPKINIKRGSFPNSINTCSQGTTPVTIWGSPGTVDVTQINPDQLILASAVVKTVGKSGRFLCSVEDVGSFDPNAFDQVGPKDGYLDLTCHFVTFGLDLEDSSTSAELTITGCSDTGSNSTCEIGDPGFFQVVVSDSVNIVRDCP